MDHHEWEHWPEDGHDPGEHDLSEPGFDQHPALFDEHGPFNEHGPFDEHGPLDEHGLDAADTADLGYHDAGDDAHPHPDLTHESELAHLDPEHLGDPEHPGDPEHLGQPHIGGGHLDVDDGGHEPGTQPHPGLAPDAHPGGQAGEHLVGADPDLPGHEPVGHGAWYQDDFPPPWEHAHRPTPIDGYPWSDPDTLGTGHPDLPDAGPIAGGSATPEDLLHYAAIDPPPPGTDPWHLLLGSDDPATSALARWWGAPG